MATAHKCHIFRFPWVVSIYRFDCICHIQFCSFSRRMFCLYKC